MVNENKKWFKSGLKMKGIILAGGRATRLFPSTLVTSKQLLPIYNKPLIYYPLSTLMMAGIREILIISNPNNLSLFKELFRDGSHLGINIEYQSQNKPSGLADAFIVGEEFLEGENSALILGDNLFFGNAFHKSLEKVEHQKDGALIFAYRVEAPSAYGVVEFDKGYNVISIEEKPEDPKSNFAVPGLYFYDSHVIEYAKSLKPSPRGELEITDLNNIYLRDGSLRVSKMRSGSTWLDAGTFDSLTDASNFVRTIENRQGIILGSPEAVAIINKWTDRERITKRLSSYPESSTYKSYIMELLGEQD